MVRRYQELVAWQLADRIKNRVFELLARNPEARANFKFQSQLIDAASSVVANLAEGFRRFNPGEFARFIDFSLASLGEVEERLEDGIALGYFPRASCPEIFTLARRCLTASIRLKQSQRRIRHRRKPTRRHPP